MPKRNLRDAFLVETKALPNGAAATSSDPIDLEQTLKDFVAPCEIVVNAPALGATPLPDAKTMIYTIEHSEAAASGYVTLATVITQTGASSAGAAAAEARLAIPSTVKRYIRLTATGSASGDASASSGTISLAF